jgi:lipid-binding SYLF domain-containing protein
MNRHTKKLASCVLATLAFAWVGAASARSFAELDAGVHATLKSFYAQNSANNELISKAAGVLVFPHVMKGAIGVGGRHGEGALLVHGNIVKRYEVTGASVGATIGVSDHSEMILFMTEDAREKFERSHGWTLGAEGGAAVAYKGADVVVDNETLQRPVLTFVMGEKGLIGDLSLQGSKISPIAE